MEWTSRRIKVGPEFVPRVLASAKRGSTPATSKTSSSRRLVLLQLDDSDDKQHGQNDFQAHRYHHLGRWLCQRVQPPSPQCLQGPYPPGHCPVRTTRWKTDEEQRRNRMADLQRRTVHTGMAKNKRQPYAVSEKAGHQTSAESWGTGACKDGN